MVFYNVQGCTVCPEKNLHKIVIKICTRIVNNFNSLVEIIKIHL